MDTHYKNQIPLYTFFFVLPQLFLFFSVYSILHSILLYSLAIIAFLCYKKIEELINVEKNFSSIREWFRQMSDPREPSGRRYSLQSLLELISAGVLSGNTSLRSIAKWGRELTKKQLESFQIKRISPSQTTLHYLLQKIDVSDLETTMRNWIKGTFFENFFEDHNIKQKISTIRQNADSLKEYASLKLIRAYVENASSAVKKMTEDFKKNGWNLPDWMRQEYISKGIKMPNWFESGWKPPAWMNRELKEQIENLKRMCDVFAHDETVCGKSKHNSDTLR